MIAVAWSGDVFTIDSATGMGTQIGNTGFSNGSGIGTNAMTIANGTVWVAYSTSNASCEFQTVNTTTGAATTISTGTVNVRGFAFDGVSTFYVIASGALHSVDPTTGVSTLIGPLGLSLVQGLAHDGTTLYGWGLTAGLMTIDTATGAATDVSSTNGGTANSSDGQFLTANPAGDLFVGRDSLYAVDKTNGASTVIGTGGYADVRGADFLCQVSVVGPGCPGTMGVPELSLNSCPASPGQITTFTSNGLPNAVYGVALGFPSVAIPFPNGCIYHVGANSIFVISALDASGQELLNLIPNVPAGFTGLTMRTQSLMFDIGAPRRFVVTRGLEFTFQ